jgi:5-hydroxytryptamine receptor 1
MLIIYLKIYQAAKTSIRKNKFKKGRSKPLLSTATMDRPSMTYVESYVCNESPEQSQTNGNAFPVPAGGDANRNNKHLTVSKHLTLTPPTSPLLLEHERERSPVPPASPFRDIPPASPFRDPTQHHQHQHQQHGKSSYLDLTNIPFQKQNSPKRREKTREKIEVKRERKAARTLAIITGAFIICWLPFFIVAVVRPFCGDECKYPYLLISLIVWLGYVNSVLNPILYTIFNPDFRLAFRKILFGKYHTRQRAQRAIGVTR